MTTFKMNQKLYQTFPSLLDFIGLVKDMYIHI